MDETNNKNVTDDARSERRAANEIELRVAATTSVQLLASSLFKNFEEGKTVVLSCIGVQSMQQALKAVGTANAQAVLHGYVFAVIPYFTVVKFDNPDGKIERTAVRLKLISRQVG